MGLFSFEDLNISDGNSEMVKSVVVESYRYDVYSDGKVLVYKGDSKEPSYEVTPVGCTCPGDRYSSNPCKHRKAVSSFGDGSAIPPVEGTVVRANQQDATVEKGPEYNLDLLFE